MKDRRSRNWRPFLKRLVDARIKANLSQAEVAFQLGIEQTSYATFERGGKRPRDDRLSDIAFILGVEVEHFFEPFHEFENGRCTRCKMKQGAVRNGNMETIPCNFA